MSDTAQHLAIIQEIYAAFGRGDVPAILERLSPDVDWEFAAPDYDLPWHQSGRGRDAVVRFFGALAAELEFKRFEPLALMGDGPWVVALCSLECVVKRSGKTFVEACEPHIWRFDEHGRVAAMRHAADTYRQWRAWQA
ncbi:MAG: nuclear transport factor 2 family protein [Myxococcota bacterium]